jgi:molecular chaperone DnaJ
LRYTARIANDFYDILGVGKSASADEIKQAYRKLSKEWHPDKHKGDKAAEAKFKEINQAYEVLGDQQKRAQYDRFGSAGPGMGGGFGGGGFDFSGFQNGDMGDLGDLFSSFFGGARGGGGPAKGADHEVGVTIDLAEAVTGAKRTIRVQRQAECETCRGDGAAPGSKTVTCDQCGGTGQVTRVAQSFFGQIQQRGVCPKCHGGGKVPEKACATCNGQGRVPKRDDITVEIPAGIADGQSLRVRGKGDQGLPGQPAGDLFVHISVRPDDRFRREGDDIHAAAAVSAIDATLGADIEVETVHGPVTVSVPAGTQPGTVMRVKGKGMPVLSTSRHGDHYLRIDVIIPKKLSREEKKLAEEWRKIQR